MAKDVLLRACVRNLDISVGAVCSIEESAGPQNLQVSIVLIKSSKSVGAKGDVPKIYGFEHPLHPC